MCLSHIKIIKMNEGELRITCFNIVCEEAHFSFISKHDEMHISWFCIRSLVFVRNKEISRKDYSYKVL